MFQRERFLQVFRSLLSPNRFKHDSSNNRKNSLSRINLSDQQLPLDIDQKRKQIKSIWMALIELGETCIPASLDDDRPGRIPTWSHLDKCVTHKDVIEKLRISYEKDIARQLRCQKRVQRLEQMGAESYEVIDKEIKRSAYFYRHRVMSSIRNNDTPHVVIDFAYDAFQAKFQYQLTYQINQAIRANRMSPEPFQIHLCNFNAETELNRRMALLLSFDDNLVFQTPKSYLDLYPRDRLVYLTRDASRRMKSFDPNKVYIIGAVGNSKNTQLASIAQANKNNIVSESLPVDQYVGWKAGSKMLHINTVLEILLCTYNGMSWPDAFYKCIPKKRIS